MKHLVLHTRLASLPKVEGRVSNDQSPPELQKKQARIAASLSNTSGNVGFLHACLVRLGDLHFAVSGPAGSGKSTLAEFLVHAAGGEIIANDWLAVEKQADQFLASDLNHEPDLKHATPCRLDGVIILTDHDSLGRDAFAPSADEFDGYLQICFDAMPSGSAKALSEFWRQQFSNLPFVAVVPTRDHSQSRTELTLLTLLKRIRPPDTPVEVGIIGTGSVGSVLASELGKLPYVHRVHLYNRSPEVAVGLALDLNQALYRGRSDIFVAHSSAEEVFAQSHEVFLVFRDKDAKSLAPDMPERWNKLASHAETITFYARLASKARFSGTIFVITNPVDMLTYGCFAATQDEPYSLRSFQVYGIGLEGDLARALFYARHIEPSFTLQNIKLFGNHSDHIVCKTNLPKKQNDRLAEQVANASAEVRAYASRTIYGPVGAAMRTYTAFTQNADCGITVIQEAAYIGRHIRFRSGLPQLASRLSDSEYGEMLADNRRQIARFGKYFGL